jgi:hypothetical protein
VFAKRRRSTDFTRSILTFGTAAVVGSVVGIGSGSCWTRSSAGGTRSSAGARGKRKDSPYRSGRSPDWLEQIKNEIAALKADKSIPEAEKKEDLAQLEAALKNTKPIQFKENIALVLKYFDQLAPIMQEQDSKLRPAD